MPPQDVMLRNSFVRGVWDEHLPQRLLTEKGLTFQRTLDLALSAESASRPRRGIKGVANSGEINRTSQIKPGSQHTSARHCYRCHGLHNHETWKFKTAECRICSKKVTSSVPASRRKNTEPRSDNSSNGRTVPSHYLSESCCKLHTVNVCIHCPKFLVDLRMEGKPVQLKVDTGAACSLMSDDTDYRTRKKTPRGFQASRSICAYGQVKNYASWAPLKFV
ncbi:uncharacterized protein [Dermacentor albipictus]|uniref:uncharacterized protein n=1 Tax=Dermacentor albipictus TaxID=60249 RepID=UPI0031FD19FF